MNNCPQRKNEHFPHVVTFRRVGSVPLPHPGKGEPSTVGFGTDDVFGLRNGCLGSSRPNVGEMKRLPFAFCFQTAMKVIEARLSATRAGGRVGGWECGILFEVSVIVTCADPS